MTAKHIHNSFENVNPVSAQRWIDNCIWPKQRPLRAWHVEELAEKMTRGEFMEGRKFTSRSRAASATLSMATTPCAPSLKAASASG